MNTENQYIHIGTGSSQVSGSYEAGESAARDATRNVQQFPFSAVLIYASVHYDLEQVSAGIRGIVGNVPILGTTTAGEICNGTYKKSVTVVVIASPYLSVHAAVGNKVSANWRMALDQAVEAPAISAYTNGGQNLALVSSGKSLFAMMFYPGNTRATSSMGFELLETFKRMTLGLIPVFGGAAADDWRMESNSVFLGDQVHKDSVLVAIFETQLEVGISLSHGFQPFGNKMTVTATDGHELIKLNQATAADVLTNCLGKSRDDLEGKHISLSTGYFFGSPDPMNQYSVNVATYFTPRGGVRMTQPVSVGMELTLLVNDAEKSVMGGSEAVRKSMIRAGTNSPALILVHYCALRPRIMGEELARDEINRLLEMAGSTPTAGFFSFGEDSVADDGISRHNNGAVAVLVLGKQLSAPAKVAQENKRLLQENEAHERANAENLSHVLFENSPTAMVAIDPNTGRIVQANDFALKMLGYTNDEIHTKSVSDLTYVEDRAEAQQLYDMLSKGIVEKLNYEKRYIRKDGSQFWADVNVSALKDSNGVTSLFIGNSVDITERKQYEIALKMESEKNRALLRNASDGIHILDTEGKVVEVSDSFCKMLGYSRDELIGMHVSQWDAKFSSVDLTERVKQLFEEKNRSQFETLHRCKDGNILDVEVSSLPLELAGKPVLFNSSRDISSRKQIELQIASSLSLVNATLESTEDAILVVDLNRTWVLHNQRFLDLWHIPEELVVAKDDSAALSFVLNQLEDPETFLNKVRDLYITPEFRSFDTLHFKNGQIVERYSIPQYINGQIAGRVWTFRDVTERVHMQEQVSHLAFYDTLTNLPNRRLLNDRLSIIMASSKRSGRYAALMFLDLDNFKPLNDTHGHVAGDKLLIEVAYRLKDCVREMDTVARFGGDEFVVILNEMTSDEGESTKQATIIADKIRAAIAKPFSLVVQYGGKATTTILHHCTVSIGVIVFLDQKMSVDEILKCADMAMYSAKLAGRNSIRFYDSNNF